jgi:hypothetical protein
VGKLSQHDENDNMQRTWRFTWKKVSCAFLYIFMMVYVLFVSIREINAFNEILEPKANKEYSSRPGGVA